MWEVVYNIRAISFNGVRNCLTGPHFRCFGQCQATGCHGQDLECTWVKGHPKVLLERQGSWYGYGVRDEADDLLLFETDLVVG